MARIRVALASDNFDRANENPLSGGGVWSTSTGEVAMQVVGNVCTPTGVSGADNGSFYSGISWPDNQFSRAKLTVTGTGGATQGVALKVRETTGAETFYRIALDHAASNNITLSRFNAGVSTTLAQFTRAWSDGDEWILEVIGAALYVLHNGVQVLEFVDSAPLTSGSPGLGLSTAVTSASINDWDAGSVEEVPHSSGGGAYAAWAETPWATLPGAATTDRRAIVTWAELETPNAPRRAIVTFAELETPNEPRRAVVTFAELETPDAPRRAVVTWAEFETPDAPANRRAIVTWAELETPDAPRRAVVTFAELETPDAPRRAIITWAEFETPDLVSTDRRAIVTWAEFEVPNAPVPPGAGGRPRRKRRQFILLPPDTIPEPQPQQPPVPPKAVPVRKSPRVRVLPETWTDEEIEIIISLVEDMWS